QLIVRVTPDRAPLYLRTVAGGAVEDSAARGSHSFVVSPGRYRVRAALDGFDEAEVEAEVRAGEESSISLSLVERRSVFESFWFWAIVGAVVAGGATAAVIATRKTDRFACAPFDGVDC